MKTTVNAYAKINLYLAVTSRRANGYHDIESVMQSVSLHDKITVEASPSETERKITLSCSDTSLPTDKRNLAYRAADAYLSAINKNDISIHIDIEKHIPVAAGLAGGSADAAGTLTALNRLMNNALSQSELASLGASLGADIPFILYGGTMTARGIGEILTPCASLKDVTILIVRPKESVSTAEAYAKIDELGLFSNDIGALGKMTDALDNNDIHRIAESAYNVFESVLPRETEVHRLKDILTTHGAVLSMMSGSGPSVFGLFKNKKAAESAKEAISKIGYEGELCDPVSTQ